MKRTGHLMEKIATLDNLYLAFKKARRGKQTKAEVKEFMENFEANIAWMRQEILDGSIAIGEYRYFKIRDPKERVISAAPFRERVLQHAIMNICHDYFDRTLIDTTYATRKGKGLYAALDKAVEAASHYEYLVKLDYRKHFDSIDHEVLKQRLRRMFKDQALLTLFDRIIDSYSVAEGKGLPIGNLTSQYFANLYLSDLDHMVKEQWKAPIYIRYMDDILLAGNDKEALKRCVNLMVDYSAQELKLTLKPPVFRKSAVGQVFLGYRILPYHCKLSGRSKKRFRSKLMTYDKLLEGKRWSEGQYQEHIMPLLSFALHAESKTFREACMAI
jgi:RNA-directed DNA polymerase